ncbi:MAG: diaminopimelate decarboxylase [Acidimicrobiales bacterium]
MAGPLPRHLLPDTAEVAAGGRCSVGGCDLLDLAAELGTPLFVYDEDHLRVRCREAVAAWGDGVAYATKAFLCVAMARLAADEGMHLDVSTRGELHVAMAAGVPPVRMVLHGNNKSEDELQAALTLGVGRIVVDSFDEIDRIERLAPAVGARPRLLVRITPGIEAHTHEFVRTGQDDSKFGFTVATGLAAEAVERLRRLDQAGVVELIGVHAHIGSNVFRLRSFEQSAEVLAAVAAPLGLPELVVGGGLGVPYVKGEEAPNIASWAKATKDALVAGGLDPAVRVTAEPGRALVAGAAVTMYTVGTIKALAGVRTYVAVDGGMSDNPRPVLYGSGYESFLPRATDAERPRAVRIVGKHCESGDVLVARGFVPEDMAVGDILATPVTGAYGHSMASTYNKVPRPPVVFVSKGRSRLVVRRESLDDLLAQEVP